MHADGTPQKLERVSNSTILPSRDGTALKNNGIELNHPATT
jgi:hypothetical protein